jgi:DNA-directed RNA polymerase specialized sigma24 family protein
LPGVAARSPIASLDEFRRRRIVRFIPWTGESRGAAPSAEHIALEGRFSGGMERALRRMPERQRSALLLAELHDLTGLELAAALGVSHVAARAILTRARESLARHSPTSGHRPPDPSRRTRGRSAS